MPYHRLKARYESKVLKPEQPLDLPEGTEVTLLIVPPFKSFLGILEGIKEDSVSLQHKVRELWKPYAD